MIFFHGLADRAPDIWSLLQPQREERPITNLAARPGNMVRSTLATDGRHLYFIWEEYESDMWVMDVTGPPPVGRH